MFKRRSLYDHVYLKIQKCQKMQISNLGLLIPSGLGTGIRDGGKVNGVKIRRNCRS